MIIRYFNIIMENTEDEQIKITDAITGTEKIIKVVYDGEYVYKCLKTQIKTKYGAEGLLQDFQKALDEKFMESMISCVARAYGIETDYYYNNEFKMIAYKPDGEVFKTDASNNIEYFDKFKNKSNYKIEIMQKIKNRWKVIYSELSA